MPKPYTISSYGLHFLWATHDDSKKQEIVDIAIDDYLRTPDNKTDSLLDASAPGRYMNIDDDLSALEGPWQLRIPGMRRLNYLENAGFTFAWLDLWTVCVTLLCFKEQDKSGIGEINKAPTDFKIDNATHPDALQSNLANTPGASFTED